MPDPPESNAPMPMDHELLLATELTDVAVSYDERDVMLYAIGVGIGSDPLDAGELPYVSELAGLRTLPTFASMIIPETIMAASGCDMHQILHRSQSLDVFRPLPAAVQQMVEALVGCERLTRDRVSVHHA